MPTVLHIDGISVSAKQGSFVIEPGTTVAQAVKDLAGDVVQIEYTRDPRPVIRQIPPEVEQFIRSYEYEDPASVLAVYWRYHSLEAEEFDTADEARAFLYGGEEYETLAGEAIVDDDQITVWD